MSPDIPPPAVFAAVPPTSATRATSAPNLLFARAATATAGLARCPEKGCEHGFAALPAPDIKPGKAVRYQSAGDPLEGFNRTMFGLHQALDKAIFRPLAIGYKAIVPKPVRGGLRHFFSNLTEPVIFVNDVLQLKLGRAAKTVARFAINSTVGVGGLIDIAKTPGFRLPYRPNGFSDTLALYGLKTGPYLFIPLLGPTTLRDLIGGQGDVLMLPVVVGRPFDRSGYQIARTVVTGLDQRAEHDEELHALFDSALDPYATLRSAYLQSRQGEIDDLRHKARGLGSSFEVEAPAQHTPSMPDKSLGTPAELSDPLNDPEVTAPAGAATDPSPPTAVKPGDPLAAPAATSGKPQ